MKRKLLLSFFIISSFVSNLTAQTTEIKEANPADVASIDAIIRAVYDIISGDADKNAIGTGFGHCFTATRD
jgi:hypothetical protein